MVGDYTDKTTLMRDKAKPKSFKRKKHFLRFPRTKKFLAQGARLGAGDAHGSIGVEN